MRALGWLLAIGLVLFILFGSRLINRPETGSEPSGPTPVSARSNFFIEPKCTPADTQYRFMYSTGARVRQPVLYYDLLEESVPGNLTPQQVIDTFTWAAKTWGKYAPIPAFKQRDGAKTRVYFTRARAMEKMKAVADTHTRAINGRIYWEAMRFNLRDSFSMFPKRRFIHLPSLVLHEVGHVLGLGHPFGASPDTWFNPLVMQPAQLPFTKNTTLCAGDIAGIQALYGVKAER